MRLVNDLKAKQARKKPQTYAILGTLDQYDAQYKAHQAELARQQEESKE
jgi:hypothetical protein